MRYAQFERQLGSYVSNCSSVPHESKSVAAQLTPQERSTHATEEHSADQISDLWVIEMLRAARNLNTIRQITQCILIYS